MQTVNTYWGDKLVGLSWVPSQELPPAETVTSVHGFCFIDDKVLMIQHPKRGWDFVGGHMENGESIADCFLREAEEEANISGSLTYLGSLSVNNTLDPNFDLNGKYPPVGTQVFYRMDITRIDQFRSDFETLSRTLMKPIDVPLKHGSWNDIYQTILDSAVAI